MRGVLCFGSAAALQATSNAHSARVAVARPSPPFAKLSVREKRALTCMSASYELLKRQLAETGQLEALRQQLREQLTDCGWREQLSERCRQLVRQRGYENLTVDQLAKELLPSGRAAVPDSVKAELLKSIKEALLN